MGLTWQILSDALRIRKCAYDYKTVISGFKVNVENVSKGKKGKLNLLYILCYWINYLNEIDHLVQIEIISIKNFFLKLHHLLKVIRRMAVTTLVVVVSSHLIRYCRHTECFNSNSIGHTAMDCTAIKSKLKVRFQLSSKTICR